MTLDLLLKLLLDRLLGCGGADVAVVDFGGKPANRHKFTNK